LLVTQNAPIDTVNPTSLSNPAGREASSFWVGDNGY
jgi:hypothetical protein